MSARRIRTFGSGSVRLSPSVSSASRQTGFPCAYLSPHQRPPEIDSSYEPTIRVCVNSVTIGYHRGRCKVVTRPACEDDDLKAVSLLVEQRAEPVHAAVIALDQLVVEDDRRLQVFRQRQPVQCGQLLPRADG